jgi:hypothetical protein
MRSVHRVSRKQEEGTATRYGGSRNAGSGNGWRRKNDVRTTKFLIENKTTMGGKQITLKKADLVGLERNALSEARIPMLQFELGDRRYVVLVEDHFIELFYE